MAALSLRLRFTTVTSRHNNITAVERGKKYRAPPNGESPKIHGSISVIEVVLQLWISRSVYHPHSVLRSN